MLAVSIVVGAGLIVVAAVVLVLSRQGQSEFSNSAATTNTRDQGSAAATQLRSKTAASVPSNPKSVPANSSGLVGTPEPSDSGSKASSAKVATSQGPIWLMPATKGVVVEVDLENPEAGIRNAAAEVVKQPARLGLGEDVIKKLISESRSVSEFFVSQAKDCEKLINSHVARYPADEALIPAVRKEANTLAIQVAGLGLGLIDETWITNTFAMARREADARKLAQE